MNSNIFQHKIILSHLTCYLCHSGLLRLLLITNSTFFIYFFQCAKGLLEGKKPCS